MQDIFYLSLFFAVFFLSSKNLAVRKRRWLSVKLCTSVFRFLFYPAQTGRRGTLAVDSLVVENECLC